MDPLLFVMKIVQLESDSQNLLAASSY